MKNKVLKIHPNDNVIVALSDLQQGETVTLDGQEYILTENIAAKHKFAMQDFEVGSEIKMYDVLVGKANQSIKKGGSINIFNVKHAVNNFEISDKNKEWQSPDVTAWSDRTFMGFYRADGKVERQIIGWLCLWFFVKTAILKSSVKPWWKIWVTPVNTLINPKPTI